VKILVSNDDGVYAEGIKALADAMRELGEVVVVAPDRNRSGASNSLTLDRPLRVKRIGDEIYSVEGTPTDCVHLAMTGLLDTLPDIVVSGINAGGNLGDDILYSGTVAAATEGRYLGLPALAFSLASDAQTHYATAAKVAQRLVTGLRPNTLPARSILNINVPDIPFEELGGFEVTRLGTRHCAEPTVKALDPRGRPIYWVGPPGLQEDAGPGTDFHAIKARRVSITPLQIDLTHYTLFDQLASWVDGFLNE
jgi:5'-nucleotidase